MPRNKAILALSAGITCAVLASGVMPARGSADGTQTLCGQYQHMLVRSGAGQTYMIRNDNFGGKRECITHYGSGPNFTVTASAANNTSGIPLAYPYIFLGCSWGLCTPKSGLPARVSNLRDPVTSWSTSLSAGGVWNATYDIWFHKTRITTGQATGGELMIWLNSRGHPAPPSWTPLVWIDHAWWYLTSWITSHAGHRWRLIQFRRLRPVSEVTGLHLMGFVRELERRGWIRPSSWMLNVDAGFEIARGGTGLATTWFSARR